MTSDEYAELAATTGARILKQGNVWWRAVRPLFYRPLLAFREVDKSSAYPMLARVGAAQHVVGGGQSSNSSMDFLIFSDPSAYTPHSLDKSCRRDLRRALRTFSTRDLVDVDAFIAEAHPVYLSFFSRTKYAYKNERVDRDKFADWARTLLSFPKVRIVGAYRGADLASVSVTYPVEDVWMIATMFSDSSALSDGVSELMVHEIRNAAASQSGVSFLFAAMAGMERGLDAFYVRRGAEVVKRRAWTEMNPMMSILLRTFRPTAYTRLFD